MVRGGAPTHSCAIGRASSSVLTHLDVPLPPEVRGELEDRTGKGAKWAIEGGIVRSHKEIVVPESHEGQTTGFESPGEHRDLPEVEAHQSGAGEVDRDRIRAGNDETGRTRTWIEGAV